jgi:hypothetical protein
VPGSRTGRKVRSGPRCPTLLYYCDIGCFSIKEIPPHSLRRRRNFDCRDRIHFGHSAGGPSAKLRGAPSPYYFLRPFAPMVCQLVARSNASAAR